VLRELVPARPGFRTAAVALMSLALGMSAVPAAAGASPPQVAPAVAPARPVLRAGGGCLSVLSISACMSYRSSDKTFQPDFYLNSLSGLPAGTRYQVWVDAWLTRDLTFVAAGVLDRTGHYGPWTVKPNPVSTEQCRTHVMVFDPWGNVLYWATESPYAY
jgi:hypothetical protein